MLRVYSAAEVHAALPWGPLADALEAAFIRGAEVPLRQAHGLGGGDSLLLMPAWSAASIGVKLVTVMPGNAARGASPPNAPNGPGAPDRNGTPGTVQAQYLLLDRTTGVPRALLDGEALTLRRTAAASALAARRLARADASDLLLVGCGRLAGWMARAHAALRPALQRIAVWGRRAEPRDALVAELRAEGLPACAVAAGELSGAVRRTHLVCCATTSREPLVRGADLRPGTHLDLVGGFTPAMREADDEAVARCRIVVDTRAGALAEAGDLVQALQSGAIGAAHVAGELAELLRGEIAGRERDDQLTLFKSVGTALEDLAAAELVIARAGP